MGVFEGDNFNSKMMKDKLTADYKQRLRSHLSGSNIAQATISYAVPVMRYTGGIIRWTKAELCSVDVFT